MKNLFRALTLLLPAIPAFTQTIASLNPSSITAAGPAFTLMVNGTGFVAGSTVQWNGNPLPTTFVSASQLSASVSVDLIWLDGSVAITVANSGGGISNILNFTINPLIPAIQQVTPSSIMAGSPGLNLAIYGTGFLFGATAQWNGSSLSTALALGSSNLLTAQVPASLLTTPGSAAITVVNQGRSGISNTVVFSVNPQSGLQITSLTPSSIVAGSAGFTLTVMGSAFISGAVVEWGGTALPTAFVTSSQLTANVSADLVATPGQRTVTVANPGGSNSNSAVFTVTSASSSQLTAAPSSVALGASQQFAQVSVGGSGPFMITPSGGFFSVSETSDTAPTSFTVQLTNTVCANGGVTCNGSITLHPTSASGGGSDLVIPVTFNTAAGSGNGTIMATPSSVTLNTVTGQSAETTVTLSTSSQTPISFSFTTSPANLTSWLSVSANASSVSSSSSTILSIFANATNITANQTGSITIIPGNGAATTVIPVALNISGPSTLSIITQSPLPSGTSGTPYSQALSATGGVTPYRGWTLIGGSLPPGMSLSTLGGVLTGLLNGVPTAPGVFTFTIEVTDNVNATAAKQFSLTINSTTSVTAVVNAASYASGDVAPGEMVVIFGTSLGPGTLAGLQLDGRGFVSTSLAGTQVLFDGLAAPLIYTEAGQVSAVVPYEVSGRNSTQVQVVYQGQPSNVVPVTVVPVMPGVFTDDASGHGQGAFVNQDGTVNSAANPAAQGSIVFFYATGEGQTIPAGVDGQPDGSPAPVPVAQPVTVTIGGSPAPVLYSGGVPGLVAGVLQVNVQVPTGIATGAAVPIVLTIAGVPSQPGVAVAIK